MELFARTLSDIIRINSILFKGYEALYSTPFGRTENSIATKVLKPTCDFEFNTVLAYKVTYDNRKIPEDRTAGEQRILPPSS